MDAAYEHFMREWGRTPSKARSEMQRRVKYYQSVKNKKMTRHYQEWIAHFDKNNNPSTD
mgnify:CR=1 FL=1